MTTLSAPASTASPAKPAADLRRQTRWLLALLLPIGPASVGLVRYLLPYFTEGDTDEVVASVTADPGGQSLVLYFGLLAMLTLVPGVLAAGRLTRRRAPRTTWAAMVLLVPGYLCIASLLATDLMLWAGADAGVDQGAVVSLYGATSSHPTTVIAAGVFVLGHVLGTILLGVAMWRSGAVPRWAAVLTIIAQPLHFTAAVIVVSPSLDLLAWGLNAVGFGAAAVAIIRLPDDEWDLPAGVSPSNPPSAPTAK